MSNRWGTPTSKVTLTRFFPLIICFSVFFFIACQDNSTVTSNYVPAIQEVYQTNRNGDANFDSLAVWQGNDGQNWLIVTAKSTNQLHVFDAANGAIVDVRGGRSDSIQFNRPNGISVFDNLLFVVDRYNKQIKIISLPDFNEKTKFGQNDFVDPMGIFVYRSKSDQYEIYITDNYKDGGDIPPLNELDERIRHFRVQVNNDLISTSLVNTFGDTTDKGAIRVAESIYGDVLNNQLLIAEEDSEETAVKVYDFQGNFTGVLLGETIFQHQVEGLTLYQSDPDGGFWIITDQSHHDNQFHVFKQQTLEYITSFKGASTRYTDGIWLTQKPFGLFEQGAFFAVDDDTKISCFNFSDILKIVF